MRNSERVPFWKRVLVFVGLWILAAFVCALFVEAPDFMSTKEGESVLRQRARVFYEMPLLAAAGLRVFLSGTDEGGQDDNSDVGLALLFAIHAALMLALRTRRSFIALSAMQIVLLAISVWSVLYLFHYENTHRAG